MSKFHMKNNLIEKVLLPSASGQQLSAACGQLHRAANKGCVHVRALGNDKRHTQTSAYSFLDCCCTFLELKAMNQHQWDNLNFWFVRVLYFCMENMHFFPQKPRLEKLSLAQELRISKPLPACRCLACSHKIGSTFFSIKKGK